ncbi:HGxxPAAW family protein [Nocardioides solisilvae]|uniref:HGxxPAAW family protein n=1 Tax=Nocardioides solisilvae TaxID=1542435 RepID=UPI000D744A90|nr:HGxxPAAW family protein [Nocardioides solisilvae]
MADNHGNTPAAWTAVSVAFVGFVIGSIALMLDPVSLVLFWVGAVLALVALPLFLVMDKMGYHQSSH